MQRVAGIGGVFFKSKDSSKLRAWYAQHLGIDTGPEGGISFEWREKDRPERVGFTVWSIFPHNTTYFDPSSSPSSNGTEWKLTEGLKSRRPDGLHG